MSEPDGDLELQGLQRELDDAFQTTRPRPAFEDELWLKIQTSRPPARRLGDALAAFFQGIREVPAVPLAAVAAVLVVVIGVGIIAYSGRGHLGGGGASSTAGESAARADQLYAGAFGRLPTPAFNGGAKNATAPQAGAGGAVPEYSGAVQLTWTGKLDLTITSAPVYRYNEPSTSSADQFASALGAVLVSGLLPVGLETADYKIVAAGDAVQSVLAASSVGNAATPALTVKLTQAELVYVLVPAGGHSFYEPAYLFSGTFQLNGATLVKRVLVPAVEPSQRTT